jgi:class 3 adenylate cyclase
MTPAEFESSERIWLQTDVRDILPSIHAPTLLMHRHDPDDEGSTEWEMLERSIPGAVRRELPGTEGNWFIGDVDAIVDAVAAHLRVDRPVRVADRVLASILFTDIVESTRRAAELGDADWRALLARHDDVARSQLERFDGRYIHTTGDGMLATFDGPARAVHCAVAIVEAVRPLGLEIRAGVHTGEVEVHGDDVQGIAVHIGARVAAKAGHSEVWVSRTVKDLVAGSGLTFEEAGEHELKGVPDRWHLYRVVT